MKTTTKQKYKTPSVRPYTYFFDDFGLEDFGRLDFGREDLDDFCFNACCAPSAV